VIDLHLHTTASDGRLNPAALVTRVHAAGVRTLSVTDHDTMSGVPAAAEAAARLGLEFLPGVEITAVFEQRDIHLLGYFLDPSPQALEGFLQAQRDDRITRARAMSKKLEKLGVPIAIEPIVESAVAEGRSVARPLLASALVNQGYASSPREAFDLWIGDGGKAYVPRVGSSPADVVRLVARAGGVCSIAHPGLLNRDHLIPSLAKAGLAAIEVYHPAHNRVALTRYRRFAAQHDLAVSGGSDFHSDSHHCASRLGSVGVPREEFMALLQRLVLAHSVVHSG
jgi:predicted metal-dependent phosphoesterase TrpH